IHGMSFAGTGTTSTFLTMSTGDLSLYDGVYNFTFGAPQAGLGNIILISAGADAITAVNCIFSIPCTAGSGGGLLAKTVCYLYCEFNFVMNPSGFSGLICTDGLIAACDFTATGSFTGPSSAGGGYVVQDTQSPAQALTVVGCDFANPSG